MAGSTKLRYLFGGERGWRADDWVASDDRVRGGKSQSYLTLEEDGALAKFHGTLDIKTLGGAGFASQRTAGEDWSWDLSMYDGISMDVASSDEKQYTLILKDRLLPQSPDGREQSTVSYEYDFRTKESSVIERQGHCLVHIPWTSLKPTYRGREKKDAPTINLRNIKRLSIMMRSFFGTQEGDFDIEIQWIAATTFEARNTLLSERMVNGQLDVKSVSTLEKGNGETSVRPGLVDHICSQCTIS